MTRTQIAIAAVLLAIGVTLVAIVVADLAALKAARLGSAAGEVWTPPGSAVQKRAPAPAAQAAAPLFRAPAPTPQRPTTAPGASAARAPAAPVAAEFPGPSAAPPDEPDLRAAKARPIDIPFYGPSNLLAAIEGTVRFTGPERAPVHLQRQSDPYCAKTPMFDETVRAKDGKLQNVFVRIANRPAGRIDPPDIPALVNLEDCTYRPHISGLVQGQTLLIKNSDDTLHHVHVLHGKETVLNRAMPPGADTPPVQWTFRDTLGGVRFWCAVHPWMKAWVYVVPHPLFAVSGEDGRFRIEGVPRGFYLLEATHEKFGTLQTGVRVDPPDASHVEFEFDGVTFHSAD